MPIIKSAIKRMHQTLKRRARNVSSKRDLRTSVKTFTTDKTAENLSKAQSELDKAVKKNLMSKNTAARKKAQLAKQAKEAGTKVKTVAKKPAAAKAEKKVAEKTAPAKAATKKATAAKKPAAKKAEK